jgi:hypothetical protein
MMMAATACSSVPQPSGFADTHFSDTSFSEPERGAELQDPQDQTPPPDQNPPPRDPSLPPRDQTQPTDTTTTRTQSDRYGRQGMFFEPGIGLTSSPSTFLLGLTAGKFINDNVAIGPMIQLGVDEDDVIFAPTLNVRGVFDIDQQGMERLKPYVEGGVGAAYIKKDHHPGDDDEWGFLVNIGFGANYELERNISLGTGVLFNMMPDDVVDERFFFSWKILQLNLYF